MFFDQLLGEGSTRKLVEIHNTLNLDPINYKLLRTITIKNILLQNNKSTYKNLHVIIVIPTEMFNFMGFFKYHRNKEESEQMCSKVFIYL